MTAADIPARALRPKCTAHKVGFGVRRGINGEIRLSWSGESTGLPRFGKTDSFVGRQGRLASGAILPGQLK